MGTYTYKRYGCITHTYKYIRIIYNIIISFPVCINFCRYVWNLKFMFEIRLSHKRCVCVLLNLIYEIIVISRVMYKISYYLVVYTLFPCEYCEFRFSLRFYFITFSKVATHKLFTKINFGIKVVHCT